METGFIEFLVRLRFNIRSFNENVLTKEYVENIVKSYLGGRGIEIMVSEKGTDGILNIPLNNSMKLWIEERGDGIILRVGDPIHPRDTSLRAWVQSQEFSQEIKARGVREVFIGDVDLGRAVFVKKTVYPSNIVHSESVDKVW